MNKVENKADFYYLVLAIQPRLGRWSHIAVEVPVETSLGDLRALRRQADFLAHTVLNAKRMKEIYSTIKEENNG